MCFWFGKFLELELQPLSRNRYDERLKEAKREKKLKIQLMAEAERARFEAKNDGKLPRLYISYGFSDIDPFTNIAFTWDLWIKFPFKVPKEKCEKFKELIQRAFKQIFFA